jgi:Uma2 family endonuclease
MTSARLEAVPRMTVDEFLDWDSYGFVGKLELVNGQVRAMSPASGTHSLIQANLAYLIGSHLRASGLPCRVGTEAPIVPRFHANDNVRAPDLAVTCAKSAAGKRFPDPVLIIEVLSPGNRKETWESILACATLPSLTEIAVIDSERVHAEIYRRDAAGAWPQDPDQTSASLDAAVTLESIGATLSLTEIYAGTLFA